MATVTGELVINFAGAADQTPWVDERFSNLIGTFQLSSGGLRPNGGIQASALITGRSFGRVLGGSIAISTNATAISDPVGVFIGSIADESPFDGLLLYSNGPTIGIRKYQDGAGEGLISHTLGSIANGVVLRLEYNQDTAAVRSYVDGVHVEALDASDGTFSAATLSVGMWGAAENNNGRRIGAFAADGFADAPTRWGFRLSDLRGPNTDALVADATGIRVIIRDAIGGAELHDATGGAVVGGEIEYEFGAAGATVDVELRWTAGGEPRHYAETLTLIDLDV